MQSNIEIDGIKYSGDDLMDLLIEKSSMPTMKLMASASDRLAFFVALHSARLTFSRLILTPSFWNLGQIDKEINRCKPDAVFRSTFSGSQVYLEWHNHIVEAVDPGLTIFTSGTTGAPKAVLHSWESISASGCFIPERLSGRSWYLAYDPASYAGLQVYFSAMASNGRLVVPCAKCDFTHHAERIVASGVDVISATPTWWRMLMAGWPPDLEKPSLHQATLGGEPVDQAILDMIQNFFRPEHLTHIYATSESGTAIVVSDRKAGFPICMLNNSRDVMLRIVDQILEIRSPYGMVGYMEDRTLKSDTLGWYCTGDIVEIVGERCFIVGRADNRINVGGVKIAPEEIETVLCSFSEVLDCVVYGKSNPIVGTLLMADIVPMNSEHFDSLSFRDRVRQILPEYKVPKHFKIVGCLGVATHGKKSRH